MRFIIFTATALLTLAACAAHQPAHPPKPDTSADIKAVVAAFAASCERSGYARGTAEHAACTLDLVNRAFPAPPPSDTVTCHTYMGTTTCTKQ